MPLLFVIGGVSLWCLHLAPCGCSHHPEPEAGTLGMARVLPLVMLLAVALLAAAQRRRLQTNVSEELTVAGETYRDVVTVRRLPEGVTRDWRSRLAQTTASSLLVALVLTAAPPSAEWLSAACGATVLGAGIFLRSRRGRAAFLYLPLLVSARSLPVEPRGVGSTLALLAFALLMLGHLGTCGAEPLGGYERDGAVRAPNVALGSWAWTGVWALLLWAPTLMLMSLPRFCCGGQIKTTEGNAREIRNAVNRWRGSKGETTCPTIAQLVADKEIDSASKTDDSWGSDYGITCTEDDVFVVSPGPDRRFRTADDISVPKQHAR